jgi:hypothetical protein
MCQKMDRRRRPVGHGSGAKSKQVRPQLVRTNIERESGWCKHGRAGSLFRWGRAAAGGMLVALPSIG